jgi:iron(III) transport system substrate-binding protein
VIVALVSALVASGCGSSSASGSAVRLTLYSAQHQETAQAIVSAFEKATGIQVRVESNDEDVLTAQIEQEGSRSPADLFYTENSNWLTQLDQQGLLAPVNPRALGNVPKVDSAADGDWVGVSARVASMVYDTSKLSASQLPTSVMDLADPAWKGKIEIAPGETDFWPVICSVQRTYGTARTVAWLQGLKANAGSNDDAPDNETVTSDVSQGAAELGVINQYYWYRLRADSQGATAHSAIAYFAPGDVGYVEDVSGAAILKSSKHQGAAQEFLSFLTSSAGQEAIANSDSFEYPLNPQVPANPQLTPLDQLHPNSFDPADLGTGLEAKELLQQVGLI